MPALIQESSFNTELNWVQLPLWPNTPSALPSSSNHPQSLIHHPSSPWQKKLMDPVSLTEMKTVEGRTGRKDSGFRAVPCSPWDSKHFVPVPTLPELRCLASSLDIIGQDSDLSHICSFRKKKKGHVCQIASMIPAQTDLAPVLLEKLMLTCFNVGCLQIVSAQEARVSFPPPHSTQHETIALETHCCCPRN